MSTWLQRADIWNPNVPLHNSPYARYYGSRQQPWGMDHTQGTFRFGAFSMWGRPQYDPFHPDFIRPYRHMPLDWLDEPEEEDIQEDTRHWQPFSPASVGRASETLKLLLSLILFIVLHQSDANSDDTGSDGGDDGSPASPAVSRRDLLAQVIAQFEQLKGASDLKPHVFGMEDVSAILNNPDQYDDDVVSLAQNLNQHQDLIDLADWVSNSSGPHTHDRTNDLLQYEGALELLNNKDEVNTVIRFIRDNFAEIAALGGNTTALERADLDAKIAQLNDGSDADKALAAALTRIYYQGAEGDVPRDLITVLANASGNNASTSQVITLDGLNRLEDIINRED